MDILGLVLLATGLLALYLFIPPIYKRIMWDREWRYMIYESYTDFKLFYSHTYGKEVYSSDIINIKNKHRGDFEFFKSFETFRLSSKKESLIQARLKRELNKLLKDISDDYSNNRVKGKIITKKLSNGNNSVTYYFENGDYVWMKGKKLGHITNRGEGTYILDHIFKDLFKKSFNKIIRDSNLYAGQRVGKKSFDNPKRDLYDTLVDNVKMREDNLKKIDKTNMNFDSLFNELTSARRQRDKIKTKYKF